MTSRLTLPALRTVMRWVLCAVVLAIPFATNEASAENDATLDREARLVFGAATAPSVGASEAVGGYSKGCLIGAIQLAANGPGWQAMRPSRNRAFGHPDMIAFIERLGQSARRAGWPGVLVGDIAQPLGGPMLTGHRSHQSGIDADIWLRPAPQQTLSQRERETIGSPPLVRRDRVSLTDGWTSTHVDVLRAAADDPATARIFVNAAIKKRLCETTQGSDQTWLRKIRPWWGHDSHFHVRLHCPSGSTGCVNQDPPPPGAGCDASLDWWFSDEAYAPAPKAAPRRKITIADLPAACRRLVSQD